jgi:hypothetical protein
MNGITEFSARVAKFSLLIAVAAATYALALILAVLTWALFVWGIGDMFDKFGILGVIFGIIPWGAVCLLLLVISFIPASLIPASLIGIPLMPLIDEWFFTEGL